MSVGFKYSTVSFLFERAWRRSGLRLSFIIVPWMLVMSYQKWEQLVWNMYYCTSAYPDKWQRERVTNGTMNRYTVLLVHSKEVICSIEMCFRVHVTGRMVCLTDSQCRFLILGLFYFYFLFFLGNYLSYLLIFFNLFIIGKIQLVEA